MERAERVVRYLCAQLEAVNNNVPDDNVLLAVLTALVELLDKDVNNYIKISATNLGLHTYLVDILNQPWAHWQDLRDHEMNEFAGGVVGGDIVTGDAQSDVVVGDASKNAIVNDSKGYHEAQRTDIDCLMHPLTYSLAMKCLYYLSTLPRMYYFKFVDRHLIQTVLKYLSPPLFALHCSTDMTHFSQFGQRYTTALGDLVEGCQGRVKVRISLNQDKEVSEWTKLLSFHEPDYFSGGFTCKELEDVHMCCLQAELFDNVENTEDALISDKFAQSLYLSVNEHHNEEFRSEKVEDQQLDQTGGVEKWVDARVTQVLRGNFLWVHLGQQCIKAADWMTRSLQSSYGPLVETTVVPNVLVVVKITNNMSQEKLIRARVIFRTDQSVTVFDIDAGHVHKVLAHTIFSLPSDLDLTHFPSLATLVYVQGMWPLHADVRAVEMAAATLAQICRFSVRDRDMILEEIRDCDLSDLITCPDVGVVIQSLHLATNLLLGKKVQWCSWWHRIMIAAVETLNGCVQRALQEKLAALSAEKTASQDISSRGRTMPDKEQTPALSEEENGKVDGHPCASSPGCGSRTQNKQLMRACLMMLANQESVSLEAKGLISQLQGLRSVIRAYLLYTEDEQTRMAAVKLLHNFVY